MFTHTRVCVLVTHLCPTLCNPMDCVAHQAPLSIARTLEWVVIPSSRGNLPKPGLNLGILHWGGFCTIWATRLCFKFTHIYTHSIQNNQQQKWKWCGNIFWIAVGNRDENNRGAPFSGDRLRRVCLCMKGVAHSTALPSAKKNQITVAPELEPGSSEPFSSILHSSYDKCFSNMECCNYFPISIPFVFSVMVFTCFLPLIIIANYRSTLVIVKMSTSLKWEEFWNVEVCAARLKGRGQSRQCPEESDQRGEEAVSHWKDHFWGSRGTREAYGVIFKDFRGCLMEEAWFPGKEMLLGSESSALPELCDLGQNT